jgi:hypothetical protein
MPTQGACSLVILTKELAMKRWLMLIMILGSFVMSGCAMSPSENPAMGVASSTLAVAYVADHYEETRQILVKHADIYSAEDVKKLKAFDDDVKFLLDYYKVNKNVASAPVMVGFAINKCASVYSGIRDIILAKYMGQYSPMEQYQLTVFDEQAMLALDYLTKLIGKPTDGPNSPGMTQQDVRQALTMIGTVLDIYSKFE